MAEEDDLWKDVPEDLPQLLQTNMLDEASDIFLAREHLLQNSQELLELIESGSAIVFVSEHSLQISYPICIFQSLRLLNATGIIKYLFP